MGVDAAARLHPDLQSDGDSAAGTRPQGLPRDAVARVGASLRLHRSAARSLAAYLGLLRPHSRPGRDARRRLRSAAKARGALGCASRGCHGGEGPPAAGWRAAAKMDPGPGPCALRSSEVVVVRTLQYGGGVFGAPTLR